MCWKLVRFEGLKHAFNAIYFNLCCIASFTSTVTEINNIVEIISCVYGSLYWRVSWTQAHLRSIDVKLMHQLLSINEGIESIRWVMEERGGMASREGSLTGSLYSLSDSQDASQQGSCSDGLDGISVGSYLDTLGEDDPENDSPTDLTDGFSNKPVVEEETFKKPPHRPRVETDEYYCFG